MRLIVEAELSAFPPRRPEQPIFYPVLTREYAMEIARDWNTKDAASGCAGYVTRFEVADAYAKRFEPRRVGAQRHEELWVPAGELPAFNSHILGPIGVTEAFFGREFTGYVPAAFNFTGKNATAQFLSLSVLWREFPMDFYLEIFASRTAVFLHYLFWRHPDFNPPNIAPAERDGVLRAVEDAWARACPTVRLPGLLERVA